MGTSGAPSGGGIAAAAATDQDGSAGTVPTGAERRPATPLQVDDLMRSTSSSDMEEVLNRRASMLRSMESAQGLLVSASSDEAGARDNVSDVVERAMASAVSSRGTGSAAVSAAATDGGSGVGAAEGEAEGGSGAGAGPAAMAVDDTASGILFATGDVLLFY